MRRATLLVGLTLLCSWGSFARATGYSRLALGGHFGYAMSRFDPDLSYKNRRAIALGGHLEWGLGSRFYLQPEIGYVSKGASVEYSQLGGGLNEQSVVYDVLDTSLLLKAKFGPREMRLVFLAGGNFSYATRKLLENAFTSATQEISLHNSLTSVDYGAVFGFGGEFVSGEDSHVFVEARYLMGLANINAVPGSNITIRTRALIFAVGVRWWV